MQKLRVVCWISLAGMGLLPAPARAACPSTSASAEARAQEALAAFSAASERAFANARETLREELGCLSDVPSPAQAALVHQVDALHWFFVKDKERALLAFQAMVESDAQLLMAPDVAPPGGAIDLWRTEAALRPPSPRQAVALPGRYTLVVDGTPSTTVPTARPTLVLIVAPEGDVMWSGMVPVGGVLPELPEVSWTAPLGKPALIGAGALALTSGALWALALRDRAQLNALAPGITANQSEAELGLSWEEARALYRRTNALGYAAQATTGAALGLGVLGVTWTW